jgi:hypothetical protein
MRRVLKLATLAVLAALGALLLLPGPGPVPREAERASAAHAPVIGVILDTDPESSGVFFTLTISGPGTCTNSPAALEDGDNVSFECTANGTYTVTMTIPSGWAFSSFGSDCTQVDVGDFTGTQSTLKGAATDTTVQINVADDEHLSCLLRFVATEPLTVTPTTTATVTLTPFLPFSAQGIAVPNQVGCGGTSIVSFQFRTITGAPVPAGTVVVFNASFGSITPFVTQTDAAGVAQATYIAPLNQGGVAVITAVAANQVAAQVAINVVCPLSPTSTPTPRPPTATPTTAPPPPTATPVPPALPRTGSAGYVEEISPWRLYGGIALIAVSVLGTFVVLRGWAAERRRP